ncbi:MAG TPA: ATP-binding protein, partial [Bacteroidota bacterium]|nr:ATP-binding protein [Bacteroidota bacterium]
MAVKEITPAQTIIFEEKVKSVLDLTDSAIAIVQDIAARLRPGMLDYLGLLAAIEWQADEFQKRSGVKCTLALLDHEPGLDSERATALFRILQETLTNVARHAHARNVRIALEEAGPDIVMTIADDGVGISRAQIDAPQSLGLLGMRERLHPFRGICTIESPSSGGTRVTVRIPGNLDRTS